MLPPQISVLLIDPNSSRAEQVVSLLRSAKNPTFAVEIAKDVTSAERLLMARQFDVGLASIDGDHQVIAYLNSVSDSMVVIALRDSASSDSLAAGADEIVKLEELDAEQLGQTIGIAIDRKRMLLELAGQLDGSPRKGANANNGTSYKTLLQSMDEALFLVTQESGELLFANATALRWFEGRIDETLADVFDYGVLNGDDLVLEIATCNCQVSVAELRSVAVSWRDQPCCLISLRDISRRKQAENAYLTSQRRLELALKSSNVGMWSWDLRCLQVSFSERWKKQLGYAESEFPDSLRAFREALHPEDRGPVFELFNRFLKAPWPEFVVSYRLRHSDGEYRHFDCRAEIFPDREGRLSTMLGTQIEQARPQPEAISLKYDARDRLVKARLAEISEKLGALADDISKHFRADSKISGRIREIERLSKSVSHWGSLLDDSSEDEPELAANRRNRFATEVLVAELKRLLANLLPQNVRLQFEQIGLVSGYHVAFANAYILLTEIMGCISHSMADRFRPKLGVTVVLIQPLEGEKPLLQIELTYEGVAADLRSADDMAEQGGAQLRQYASGDDCIVEISLPLAKKPKVKQETPRARSRPANRIALLAEDEDVLRFAVESMLRDFGYEVLAARDGEEALAVFRQNADRIDVAIVDMRMPKVTGDEVLQAIRSSGSAARVVLMSGDDEDALLLLGEKGEEQAQFLSKPFGSSALKEALSRLCPT